MPPASSSVPAVLTCRTPAPEDLHTALVAPEDHEQTWSVKEAASGEPWSATQAAAVAAAEAIAATAAAEVAAEAAATAQAAVDVASAAAVKAAAKASAVAAQAVVAAAAAAVETLAPPSMALRSRAHETAGEQAGGVQPALGVVAVEIGGVASGHEMIANAATAAAATAAAKVALSVVAVASAAATAAVEAATLIGDQLAADVAAAAAAVAVAAGSAQPAPVAQAGHQVEPALTATEAVRVVPGGLALAAELRRGIAVGQLRLQYQPIINLDTGRAVGVEALVRWQHPQRGLLEPLEFMDVAERTDVILPLGAWVLHEACRVAVRLQAGRSQPLTVAVNLSGRQLSDPGLVTTVRAALRAHGCAADRLVFEVTETALVTDMATAIDSMRQLQALGAGVAIDDFGTGYSSLLYLKHLSANDLKIDRSFVRGLGVDSYDTTMVASLISLAHNLGVRCVAEGVETIEQFTLLRKLGCDFAQGYLFSRPMDAAALQEWLGRHVTSAAPPSRADSPCSSPPARLLALLEQGASPHTIAAALNSDGHRTADGVRWSARSVTRDLLHRPA